MTHHEEWDWPPQRRTASVIEGRVEQERVVYYKRPLRVSGPPGRKSLTWDHPEVTRLVDWLLYGIILVWKIAIWIVLTMVILGSLWFIHEILTVSG